MEKLYSKNIKKWVRLLTVLLTWTMVLMLILSVERTYGTYIFDTGSSDFPTAPDASGAIVPITDGFATRGPLLGDLVFGSASFIKINLFLVAVAGLAAIKQMISFNEGTNVGITSSVLITLFVLLGFATAATLGSLVVGILALITSLYTLTEVVLKMKGKLA